MRPPLSAKTRPLAPGLLSVTMELGRGHHRVRLFLVDQSLPAALCVQMVGVQQGLLTQSSSYCALRWGTCDMSNGSFRVNCTWF